MTTLRDYQRAAVEAVERELSTVRSTLIVMPTGTGKTIVFSELIRRWNASGRGRVLVLAHREELLEQACAKIAAVTGIAPEIEKAERHAGPDAAIVVASVQTLAIDRRRQAFPPGAFSLIIVDEAHHAPAASYRAILDHFATAKILGCTATPDRCDGAAMGDVFQSVAFTYRLRDAIDEKYLVPIRQRAVHVAGLDLSTVRTVAGDLDAGDLEEIMLREDLLHQVAAPLVELAGERPTLVFASGVEHAHKLAEVIARHGRGALALDGSTPADERRAALRDFREGQINVLVNCALFTEGFDEPTIACVAVARPTKSRALYAQMIGRGTRLAPGKPDLIVLDFSGNAGKHSLVSAADILAGNEDAAVLARARKLAHDGELPVHEALDLAREQIAAEQRAKVIAQARFETTEIDPFNALAVLGAAAPRATWWAAEPLTEKQAALLDRSGIDHANMSKGTASALIDSIIDRQRRGLCTYKQARLLARHGLDPDVSFAQASAWITVLARNRWCVPASLKVAS